MPYLKLVGYFQQITIYQVKIFSSVLVIRIFQSTTIDIPKDRNDRLLAIFVYR